ncbi:hypothetical protein ANCCEY_11011 [Ancylostoma ceylanicum]|uniref:Fork-head domain-containing protein n=1 Tax=Ancylostoma ceylanicum TaxID=53326 RepID=A0A0D6LQH6_9BILA|nr:hypothetical protein ANCCEY_11011 [Ancylostoma ceylanicum]
MNLQKDDSVSNDHFQVRSPSKRRKYGPEQSRRQFMLETPHFYEYNIFGISTHVREMDFLNSNPTLQLPQSLSKDEELVTTAEAPRLENIERPSLSYKDLIIEAIESSPEKRLKLNEIYQREEKVGGKWMNNCDAPRLRLRSSFRRQRTVYTK